jgi:hypothetical protein
MAPQTFKVGDIVCYRTQFLRSVDMYTDVPKDGVVTDGSDSHFPLVRWCDRDQTVRVNTANLVLRSLLHLEPA